MSQQAKLDEVVEAVLCFDPDKVAKAASNALDAGISPTQIIEDGLTKGLRIVGQRFENGELFLMHLVAAAEASKKALNEIIEPRMVASKSERKSLGKIVIGTVAGDIHDIGKNIVSTMLFAAGFEVHDLGKDVPVTKFLEKSKEVHADVIASSALLTTTMTAQRDIVTALVEEKHRDKVKVLVGGAPVTEAWVKEIGADGFADNAVEAVRAAKRLLNVS